ncbi:dihydrolipoyl dehydrogenase [Sphingomonas montana]|uniref:dihydrolipoyl dehydrogenase n=1 Tax=Sphingomonas montana TaxID=1843236 RepID=UPI00096C8C9D|nr:dihydrolipoyl dehydrogenase [Sphingomonas montana]
MQRIDCDVAIIGAGSAGLAAYKAAAATGAHAVVIEAGPDGTTCARVGCMPSKALIAAAASIHHARQAASFGVSVGTVGVDGPAVMDRVRRERDYFVASVMEDVAAIPADRYIRGRARFTAPDRLSVDGGPEIAPRAIVIAAGSAPKLPDILDAVADRVRTSDTIFEIATLPATLAVLGAGAIGLELAAAFARLGTRVTVIDKSDGIAGIADPDAERVARDRLAQDFTIHLGADLTAAEPVDGGVRLAWDGDAAGEDSFELVLAAAGRPPALDMLGLDASGLDRDDHGTPHFAAATGRCGDSMVFIAGDARACRPVLHEAARSGRLAGHNAARPDDLRRDPILPLLAITFTDPQIAVVGVEYDELPDDGVTGTASFGDNGRVHVEARSDGLVRLYADHDGGVLGATIVGPDAEHVAHLVAHGIASGLTLHELADQAYYHPTTAEVLQNAARDALLKLDATDA